MFGINNFRRKIFMAFLFSLPFSLVGCDTESLEPLESAVKAAMNSFSNPSESDGKAVINSLLARRKDGGKYINIRKFKKLDGVAQEIFGQKIYIMKYEAEVEFIQDARYDLTCDRRNDLPHYWLPQFDQFGLFDIDIHIGKKGTVKNLQGVLHFEKSENGWHLSRQPGNDDC